MNENETRIIECGDCGADVEFTLQHGYNGPDISCNKCGATLSDHAAAVADAKSRLTVEEATPIALRYTYGQLMDMARSIYDNPASATPEQLDALAAFRLLRASGLPCHAPDRTN